MKNILNWSLKRVRAIRCIGGSGIRRCLSFLLCHAACEQGEERQYQVCLLSCSSFKPCSFNNIHLALCCAAVPLYGLGCAIFYTCNLYQLIGMTSTHAQAALDRAAINEAIRAAQATAPSMQKHSVAVSVPIPNSSFTTFEES